MPTIASPTPGPWDVEYAVNGTLQPFSEDGRHLLSCEGDNPLPLAERRANAVLIAAAPDLLAEYATMHERVTDLVKALNLRGLGGLALDIFPEGSLDRRTLKTIEEQLSEIDIDETDADDD